VAAVTALALTLAACGGGDSSAPEAPAGPAPEAPAAPEWTAEDRTLIVAASGTPGSLDGDIFTANMQATVTNVYDQLVTYGYKDSTFEFANGAREIDPDQLQGKLATSWTSSPAGLRVDFTLRQGVRSFFGNELTADDVVWSWEKSAAQRRTGAFIGRVSNVASVEAVDTYTVRFNLSSPSPVLLAALSIYVPSIYDSTEVKKHVSADDPYGAAWLAQNTAGFGPYHLESISADEQAVFVANPNYWGEQPFFQRVIYRAVPDAANRTVLLQAGSVDYIENPTFRQIVELRSAPGVKVQSVVGNQQARILMNPNFEPFDDRRVRQAINYALDHEATLRIVFEGLSTQATSPVTPGFACFTDEFWAYDRNLDKARALLADAGHADGLDIELIYSGVWWWEEPWAIQAQSQLAEAGINVKLTRIENAEMTSRAATGTRNLPFFTFYEQSIALDPGYALFLNSHPNGASDRNDYGRTNPEFVALVEAGNKTLDPQRRCELFLEAQRLHVEDAAWVYGAMMGTHVAQKNELNGWVWWADNNVRWYDLYRER
jgi:ABC-type transport system substrate-binding protein